MSCCMNRPDCFASHAGILAGRHVLRGLDKIEEVVRTAGTLRCRGFGRSDLELTVHRNRITVNDLALERTGKGERQGSLSAGRRSRHDQQNWIGIPLRHVQRAPQGMWPQLRIRMTIRTTIEMMIRPAVSDV